MMGSFNSPAELAWHVFLRRQWRPAASGPSGTSGEMPPASSTCARRGDCHSRMIRIQPGRPCSCRRPALGSRCMGMQDRAVAKFPARPTRGKAMS